MKSKTTWKPSLITTLYEAEQFSANTTPGSVALVSLPVVSRVYPILGKAVWKKTMAQNITKKMKMLRKKSHFRKMKYETTPVPW